MIPASNQHKRIHALFNLIVRDLRMSMTVNIDSSTDSLHVNLFVEDTKTREEE